MIRFFLDRYLHPFVWIFLPSFTSFTIFACLLSHPSVSLSLSMVEFSRTCFTPYLITFLSPLLSYCLHGHPAIKVTFQYLVTWQDRTGEFLSVLHSVCSPSQVPSHGSLPYTHTMCEVSVGTGKTKEDLAGQGRRSGRPEPSIAMILEQEKESGKKQSFYLANPPTYLPGMLGIPGHRCSHNKQ